MMVCPNCGNKPVQETITENCSRKACVNQATLDEYMNSVNKNLNIDIEDPCMGCMYNVVTCDPGTLIGIEQSGAVNGSPRFVELHECSCGTKYKISR